MNGFIEEVCTQGKLLETVGDYYRTEGEARIGRVVEEFHQRKLERVILSGMGSSLYAMDAVRSYLTMRGVPCLAFSAFELSRFQFDQIDDKTLLIAVSQSGNSAEVVELVEKARSRTLVVGIYNNEESKLSQLADIPLPLRCGKEVSITSKTYELTMLLLNIIAHRLTGELDQSFWEETAKVSRWVSAWVSDWEKNATPMYEFAKDVQLFDLLANNVSLATARQLSLAYREGLHNSTAVWECADYAHGQYHSAKMGRGYLAQMFFPTFEAGTKEEKMLRFILDKGGRVMLYTATELPRGERVFVVKLPRVRDPLMPLMESVAAETMLGMLFGPTWVKDH